MFEQSLKPLSSFCIVTLDSGNQESPLSFFIWSLRLSNLVDIFEAFKHHVFHLLSLDPTEPSCLAVHVHKGH